jgi:hypothetical protein
VYVDNTFMDRPEDIAGHIAAARSGTAARVIGHQAGALWPGGAGDRTHPAARSWLRLWRPRHPVGHGLVPACGCDAGRCAICN